MTTRPQMVGRPDFDNISLLDHRALPSVLHMGKTGILVDRAKIDEIHAEISQEMYRLECEVEEISGKKVAHAGNDTGLNLGSGDQVCELLFDELGLSRRGIKMTRSRNRLSVAAEELEKVVSDHDVVKPMMEWKKAEKLLNTYTQKLPLYIQEDGRIRPEWRITKASTGRLACVVGDTPIVTFDGTKRAEDIRVGDLVWTHHNRWRRILAAWKNGYEDTYQVRFSNSQVLTCTMSHRLLVYDHERVEELDPKPEEHQGRFEALPIPRMPDERGDSQATRDNPPQYHPCLQRESLGGRAQSSGGDTVLTVEIRGEQSTLWEEGERCPQVEGRSGRWVRLRDLLGGTKTTLCASPSHGESFGVGGTSRVPGSTSHRRRPEEQRPGQPGSCDPSWTQTNPLSPSQGYSFCSIEEINFAGCREVYDFTVEEDESYLACGVFSHNCAAPNLMNIPVRSKLGKKIREAFVAGRGRRLIGIDLSQIEIRVAAHESADPNMMQILLDGDDFHWRSAELIFRGKRPPTRAQQKGEEPSPPGYLSAHEHRKPTKNLNFGILYGITAAGLRDHIVAEGGDTLYWTEERCQGLIDMWFNEAYAMVGARMSEHHRRARLYGFVWTMFGRIRHIPQVQSVHERIRQEGLRMAGNMPIQGGAQDILKMAMGDIYEVSSAMRDRGHKINEILQIHDELVFEVPADMAEDVGNGFREIMEQAVELRVPVLSDLAIGERWRDLD